MTTIQRLNPISGTSTKPLGMVYPDDSHVQSVGDYSGIDFDLDENDNSLIIDFARDHGEGTARGATVRFRRRQLVIFIAMLQGALECLEPGESDGTPEGYFPDASA